MPDNPYDALYELDDPNKGALKNPRVKQFLNKIGKSEGADYNTLVGGSRINDLSRHPNKVGLRTSAGPSTAFGKYQIVGTTDRSKLRKYRHLDYSPENQDLRAVELLRQTGALAALERDDEPTAIRLAGKEWASLPGSSLPGRKNYRAFQQAQRPVSSNPYDALHKQETKNPYDALYDSSQGQTPPRQTELKTSVIPRDSAIPPTDQSVPLPAKGRFAYAGPSAKWPRPPRAQRKQPEQSDPRAVLMRQFGQQRTVDESQRQNEEATRAQVEKEYRGRRGMAGSPTLTGALHAAANPVDTLTGLFRSDDENIARETQEVLRRQEALQTPEATDIRKGYGKMSAAGRAALAPMDRLTASALGIGSGLASAFGVAPNRLSDWADKRARVLEVASSAAPLKKKQDLSSLITGDEELEEIERGVPEKILTGFADLGIGLTQIVLLKKATGLPFNQLLALEAAAKNSSESTETQLSRAAEGYALGSALESVASRGANAALNAVPTAAQTGYEVSQGRMSPVDAAIQTGIPAGAGAALTRGRQPSALERGMERLPTRAQVEPDAAIAAKLRGQREIQNETQSPVETQRKAVEPAVLPVETVPARAAVDRLDAPVEPVRESVETPARFYHRDYGEVAESANQRRVGKNRVRVTAEDGSEHVIKRSAMSGAGNQRSVPIREPTAEPVREPTEVEPYLEPPARRGPIVTEPVTDTAAKKSAMAEDRAALDLPELPAPERKSWQRSLDKARPERASLLADEVLNRPRSLNDSETASLVVRAQEIKNEHAAKMREIGESADAEAITAKRNEVEALEREFDKLTRATKLSGTEKGRTLAAQKLTVNQDYDLVSLVQRAKAAKGRELTPEERTRYEQQATRITELEAQLKESQVKAEQRFLDNEIRKVSRQRQRSETKITLDSEYAQLRTDFAQARAEARNVQASGLAGLDPEGKLTKLVAQMAKNRIKAGINSTEALVSELYDTVKDHGWSRDDVLGVIRNTIHESDDVLSRWDKTRQAQLLKQQAEFERRLNERDFGTTQRAKPAYTRETLRLQKEVEEIKARYNRELYRATRGRGGMITDELAKAANVPKTLKSIGDISAVFRQGGYYALSHPVAGLAKPTRAMLQSFTDLGWRNVEAEIKSDPAFAKLRDAGVEFTGVDKADPNLTRREEGYLGGEYLAYVPVAKQIKDFSERTFVSFLDAQRLHVGKTILDGMTEAQRNDPTEVKAVAKLVNIATGRGSLGSRGNQLAPALNIAMFSPRLLASRVQLLNNMINPVTIAKMPPGARKAMIKDNVKFLAATGAILGLAKAAGATVSLDPDDAEFLKIRFGNTVYDQLTGLQQPLRYIINMGRAVNPVNIRALQSGPEMYSGKNTAEMTKQFARSKLNPALAPVIDAIAGEDFEGRKFSASREARDLITPLPAKDVYEGLKEGGIIGALKTAPTFVGIGTGSYPPAPDKPKTHAEKLARKFTRESMPDRAREEEQVDIDRQKSQLRARSRRGEDVSGDLAALGSKITERQAKAILAARSKTRLQEDASRLGIREALLVYGVANEQQRAELKELMVKKTPLVDALHPDEQVRVRAKLAEYGISAPAHRPSRPSRESRPSRTSAP